MPTEPFATESTSICESALQCSKHDIQKLERKHAATANVVCIRVLRKLVLHLPTCLTMFFSWICLTVAFFICVYVDEKRRFASPNMNLTKPPLEIHHHVSDHMHVYCTTYRIRGGSADVPILFTKHYVSTTSKRWRSHWRYVRAQRRFDALSTAKANKKMKRQKPGRLRHNDDVTALCPLGKTKASCPLHSIVINYLFEARCWVLHRNLKHALPFPRHVIQKGQQSLAVPWDMDSFPGKNSSSLRHEIFSCRTNYSNNLDHVSSTTIVRSEAVDGLCSYRKLRD